MKKKIVALVLVCVLVFGIAVGGTLAWLVTKTNPVVNTFTVGDINIKLEETTNDFKMVPGVDISKDPEITVKGNSEACWLFVEIDESTNVDDFIVYSVATGWTALDGNDGVYYREVASNNSDQVFNVLANDKVTVKDEVTKTQINALTSATMPELTFTAFAVQKSGFDDVADAWDQVTNAVLSQDW